jgi:predicted transposase YdaD
MKVVVRVKKGRREMFDQVYEKEFQKHESKTCVDVSTTSAQPNASSPLTFEHVDVTQYEIVEVRVMPDYVVIYAYRKGMM